MINLFTLDELLRYNMIMDNPLVDKIEEYVDNTQLAFDCTIDNLKEVQNDVIEPLTGSFEMLTKMLTELIECKRIKRDKLEEIKEIIEGMHNECIYEIDLESCVETVDL